MCREASISVSHFVDVFPHVSSPTLAYLYLFFVVEGDWKQMSVDCGIVAVKGIGF